MLRCVLAVGAATLAFSAVARADAPQCHVVDVEFTPAADLQIVAWLEDPTGKYLGTVFLTQLTGTYGLGNRPGIKDFNSGWHWPYGRREMVLPVWAHRHGFTFPKIVYRNEDDLDLSHPFDESSQETFFCRPLMPGETQWDTQTCSSTVYTDKGKLSGDTSLYPPRADVTMHAGLDDPAVATYKGMNPFDSITAATPRGGMDFTASWPIPPQLQPGNYVLFVEVSKEFDFNDTYNATTFPPPRKPDGSPLDWSSYGLPARGQPSIVYRVPFTMGQTITSATTSSYAGYGDAEGNDGVLHAPDATITTDTPGSGAARLQLTADGQGGTFRVRVTSRPEHDTTAPAAPSDGALIAVDQSSATVAFTEPGDDGTIGKVSGYEVRYRAGTPMTDANFASSSPIATTITPAGAGNAVQLTVDHLLPQTEYWIGVRAFDKCKNYGPLLTFDVTTQERQSGYVDACFVATAAYGSLLANDVELLRRFRDQYLESNVLGELAVETYYSVGPAVAGVVDQSEPLRATARAALAPVVELIRGLATPEP